MKWKEEIKPLLKTTQLERCENEINEKETLRNPKTQCGGGFFFNPCALSS
jgi:hypothetical protein